MFSSTCLNGIWTYPPFMPHHTCTQRGQAVAEACRGYTDNAGCLHRWALWHKESPRNQNTGGGPDSTMLPHREAALVRPGRTWTAARRDSGQRARHNPVLHTSATSRQIALERLKLSFQTYSIITICITIENSTIEILTTCRCDVQIGVTYISLLCINSMRSVKRTSRFLSQKPSAS